MAEDKFVNVYRPAGSGRYACPCCAHLTLDGRGNFDICPVCFWEDDGQDNHNADQVRGGPNRELSLTQTRRNFRAFGASNERRQQFVRPATAEEIPPR